MTSEDKNKLKVLSKLSLLDPDSNRVPKDDAAVDMLKDISDRVTEIFKAENEELTDTQKASSHARPIGGEKSLDHSRCAEKVERLNLVIEAALQALQNGDVQLAIETLEG